MWWTPRETFCLCLCQCKYRSLLQSTVAERNSELVFRVKVDAKKSMRNFNNVSQTTLPEQNESITPPNGQLSIPVLSLFSLCNYHNSLPNKLLHVTWSSIYCLFFACSKNFLHSMVLEWSFSSILMRFVKVIQLSFTLAVMIWNKLLSRKAKPTNPNSGKRTIIGFPIRNSDSEWIPPES